MSVSIEALAACASLAELTPQAREAVGECARRVDFRPAERLIPFGQPAQRLLILTSGLAKQVAVSITGHERILALYRAHDMVGPNVLMVRPESSHEVIAMKRTSAFAISRRDVFILGRTHPSLIMALTKEVSRQFTTLARQLVTATSDEVPVRLAQVLLEFADAGEDAGVPFVPLQHRLTHEAMAQMVGASRPHVSTVLRDLEDFGALRRSSPRGLLVHPSRLGRIIDGGRLAEPFTSPRTGDGRLSLSA